MKILLTHSPEAMANYYGERALATLRQAGEVVRNNKPHSLEGEELINAAKDCDLIVSYRQSPGPAELFERLPKLVAFLRCAIDIRNVDVAAASKAGVLVTQASAGFITSVSELVVGFLVDLSRGITRSAHLYHHGRVPKASMGRELKGSTIGVIGYGAIGKELVRVCRALGMRVLINDPYQQVDQVSLDQLLRESDYVVPLAVATAETENLIGKDALAKMKDGAYLINVSRGNLVDEAALEAALDSGRLAGCAMDVGRAPDQMPTPRLAAREDVIATPHTAGLTPQAIEHQSMETAAQAAEIVQGRAPKGAVNAQHWTRQALLRK
ncbi:MAG TPA: hydroxyacid dehydrogenase [Burkholderiales bacterium]|nr:hydroxyacid dehydrogenase [Burkholderiales bacterium]